MQSVERSEL